MSKGAVPKNQYKQLMLFVSMWYVRNHETAGRLFRIIKLFSCVEVAGTSLEWKKVGTVWCYISQGPPDWVRDTWWDRGGEYMHEWVK